MLSYCDISSTAIDGTLVLHYRYDYAMLIFFFLSFIEYWYLHTGIGQVQLLRIITDYYRMIACNDRTLMGKGQVRYIFHPSEIHTS